MSAGTSIKTDDALAALPGIGRSWSRGNALITG